MISLMKQKRGFGLLATSFLLLTLFAGCRQDSPPPETTAPPATALSAASPTAPAVETPPPTAIIAGQPTAPLATATAEATQPAATPTVTELPPPTATPVIAWPGALIDVSLESQVGVLLDELPEWLRDQAVEAILQESEAFWEERARRQTQLTYRRLNFRNFVYTDKGQLPLPPESLWEFQFDPAGPSRQTIQGRDLVVIGYTLSTTLLTDEASPGIVEPALAEIGGVWHEPFILPLDPEMLYQRTGNACLNESGFPPNSYDSENAWIFYDFECQPDSRGFLGCHRSVVPPMGCLAALNARVGTIETAVRFERLPWDDDLADRARLGEVTHTGAPDMKVVGDDLEKQYITYRYFGPNSCAVREQCVAAPGWRRILQFSATVHNVGTEALHVGQAAEDPHLNIFNYDPCHDHFHFDHYGEFLVDTAAQSLASKQAFCVESTGRYSNNETSPLHHPYNCSYQGISAGWVDEYAAGLDCQWMDITDAAPPDLAPSDHLTMTLSFLFNPDRFLCEGTPLLDEQGEQLWEDSGRRTEDGRTIRRPVCEFLPDWDANNFDSREFLISAVGSVVSTACERNHLGPLRNCGFSPPPAEEFSCQPGEQIQLSCSIASSAPPQVMRFCEVSAALGIAIPCMLDDALANQIITSETQTISIACPGARDAAEPGGVFALFTAPLLPDDEAAPVSCAVE